MFLRAFSKGSEAMPRFTREEIEAAFQHYEATARLASETND